MNILMVVEYHKFYRNNELNIICIMEQYTYSTDLHLERQIDITFTINRNKFDIVYQRYNFNTFEIINTCLILKYQVEISLNTCFTVNVLSEIVWDKEIINNLQVKRALNKLTNIASRCDFEIHQLHLKKRLRIPYWSYVKFVIVKQILYNFENTIKIKLENVDKVLLSPQAHSLFQMIDVSKYLRMF